MRGAGFAFLRGRSWASEALASVSLGGSSYQTLGQAEGLAQREVLEGTPWGLQVSRNSAVAKVCPLGLAPVSTRPA